MELMDKAFNEWMRRYIEEPEQYSREFEMVRQFEQQENAGQEPSYGRTSGAYLRKLMLELENGK